MARRKSNYEEKGETGIIKICYTPYSMSIYSKAIIEELKFLHFQLSQKYGRCISETLLLRPWKDYYEALQEELRDAQGEQSKINTYLYHNLILEDFKPSAHNVRISIF